MHGQIPVLELFLRTPQHIFLAPCVSKSSCIRSRTSRKRRRCRSWRKVYESSMIFWMLLMFLANQSLLQREGVPMVLMWLYGIHWFHLQALKLPLYVMKVEPAPLLCLIMI